MVRTLKSTDPGPPVTAREDKVMLIARTVIENLEPGDLGAFLAQLLVASIEKLPQEILEGRYQATVQFRAANPSKFNDGCSGRETTEQTLVELILERRSTESDLARKSEEVDDEAVVAISSAN
jgi:hypothetical protein